MSIKKQLTLLCFAALFCATAAENLIMNGDFKAEKMRFPPYWMASNHCGGRVDYFRSGGPGNRPFFRLSSTNQVTRLQQNNSRLVEGETYCIGAWFRTRNVIGKESGIRVGPGSFAKVGANALTGLPRNTNGWKYYERKIKMVDPQKPLYPYYTVDIVLDAPGGELDVAGIKLVPVTQKAKRKSLSPNDAMEPHLVPVSNLWYIPKAKPALDFAWVGCFPGDPDYADCEFIFSKEKVSKKVPFSLKRFTVDFSGVLSSGVGEQKMTVRILSRASGKILHEDTYPVRCMDIPQPKDAKKLNNLVTELYNGSFTEGEKIAIQNPRYGFLLFRFLPETKNGKFQILMNGKALFTEKSLRSETIRVLEPGEYSFEVKGAKGTFITRLIPDVMTFALMNSLAPGNGRYDWEFAKKYIIPGMTTLNVAGLSKKEYAEFKELGRQYLTNYGIMNWKNPNVSEEMLRRMEKSKVFSNPRNDGTSMDEAECWYPPMLDPYAWALWHFPNRYNKLIVTYLTAPITPAYLNVVSAAANVSKGRGWMGIEVYSREPDNEKDAEKHILHMTQHWDIFRGVAPGLFDKAGVILGMFSAHPHISLAHYPSVDYKYYLDMQLHAIATHSSFKSLGKLGLWGLYSADEEIVRWAFRLMRHYAFEGKKNMLSKEYGFKLIPGYLKNPDFREGLKFWKHSGRVSIDNFPGYAKRWLKFHGSQGGTGDVVAVFPRTKDSFCELSQTAKGLEKGKKYLLYYYVGDLEKIIKDQKTTGQIGLDVTLSNVEIIQSARYKGRGIPEYTVNTHKIIFKALENSVELKFSNRKMKPGRSGVLNYICLRPYYDVESEPNP
jgi:hypothetical protein